MRRSFNAAFDAVERFARRAPGLWIGAALVLSIPILGRQQPSPPRQQEFTIYNTATSESCRFIQLTTMQIDLANKEWVEIDCDGTMVYKAIGVGTVRSLSDDRTWTGYIYPALRRWQDEQEELLRKSGRKKLVPVLEG